ncbi:MAG TPA: amidohydrolase family protein [Pyrinomonadaceae bacterium]|jgi:imidazolonepropionase-like amidohydrolase
MMKAKPMRFAFRGARMYPESLIVIIALVTVAAALLPAGAPASAQQPAAITAQQGRSLPQGLYAIRNARVVTVSGPVIESGTIIVRDGKIESVGANVTVPAGAQELDARGLSVYPGMIDLGTSLGLVEIEAGAPGTVDLTEVGDMNPNAQAIFGINPHTAHVTITRANGVTTVLSSPRGGIISGQAALINLDGTTPREMAVTAQAALVITFPRASAGGRRDFASTPEAASSLNEAITTRDRQIEQLRKLIRDAEAYGKAQDAYARDKSLPRPEQNVVLAALAPYARGERPVIMRADREVEIRASIRFADEMRLQRPIILGGNDAWKIATFLRERNVSVILTGVLDLPNREDDYYDQLYANAARLSEAGVRFAISTGDTGAQVRDLPYHAGMAAAFGLPRDEALKAVTLYPAQIMGAADRIGSIEPGKLANLVIADGDILEARTQIRHLFIAGRNVPLTNRQTELYQQFKDRK